MIFTFIPEPKNAQQAAFQARMMSRAQTLLSDGYRLLRAQDVTGYTWYNVITPDKAQYTVDITPGQESCTCKCGAERGYCKHLIAVALEDERLHDEALVAEYEARGY